MIASPSPIPYRNCLNLYRHIEKPGSAFTIWSQYVVTKKRLDQGASKILIETEDGRIVFIPNIHCFDPVMDYEAILQDEIPHIVPLWPKIIEEEIFYSNKAKELGLLNANYQRCTLDSSIETIFSESFENMAKRGLYVVENGFRTCAWLKENRFLFDSEARSNMSGWEERVQDLVRDVEIICNSKMPIDADCLHTAIYKKDEVFTIRYFGFDFYQAKNFAQLSSAREILNRIISPIVNLEFRGKARNGFTHDLVNRCMEKMPRPFVTT